MIIIIIIIMIIVIMIIIINNDNNCSPHTPMEDMEVEEATPRQQ